MAFVYSVMLENSYQKKPSLPKEGATKPQTDSIAQFYYLCCVCISILKCYIPCDQKLCMFEIVLSYRK